MLLLQAPALQVNRQGRAGCGQNLGTSLPLPGTKVASEPPQMQKRRMVRKGYPCPGAYHDCCPQLLPGTENTWALLNTPFLCWQSQQSLSWSQYQPSWTEGFTGVCRYPLNSDAAWHSHVSEWVLVCDFLMKLPRKDMARNVPPHLVCQQEQSEGIFSPRMLSYTIKKKIKS